MKGTRSSKSFRNLPFIVFTAISVITLQGCDIGDDPFTEFRDYDGNVVECNGVTKIITPDGVVSYNDNPITDTPSLNKDTIETAFLNGLCPREYNCINNVYLNEEDESDLNGNAYTTCTKCNSYIPNYCNGLCVDIYNDIKNCGKYGNECPSGKVFTKGECAASCSKGQGFCGGKCVDPLSDPSYCGATGTTNSCESLGTTCSSGQVCTNANCATVVIPEVGDIITFGHYEQDNDTTNGKEPIEWRVLDINSSNQVLIVSERVLEAKPYNTKDTAITWEKSTIRSWLNGYAASYNTYGTDYTSDNFIDTAFTTEEQAKIVESTVPAHINPEFTSISPGNATTDKIFLLSITEANQYFTSDSDRQADATRYAIKHGLAVQGSESGTFSYSNDGTCTDVHCYAYWWLRSPGIYTHRAALVPTPGSVDSLGKYVRLTHVGVRPALWLNY